MQKNGAAAFRAMPRRCGFIGLQVAIACAMKTSVGWGDASSAFQPKAATGASNAIG